VAITPRVTAAMCAYGRTLAEPRLSPDGTRVAFLANAGGRAQLVVVDTEGGPELVVTNHPPPRPTVAYGGGAFDWTPAGDALVYAAGDGGLWWVSADGGVPRCVAPKQPDGPIAAPAVSPDGASVAFVVDQHHVGVVSLDGSGWPTRISSDADFCFDPVWSPSGDAIAWHEWDVPDMPWDSGRIVAAAADGSGSPDVIAGGPGISVQQPRYGPDGTLAYLSDETGWLNVWVGEKPLVNEATEHGDPSWGLGQRSYAWSPEGDRIVFCRNDGGFGSINTVDVATGESRQFGKGVHGGLSWRGSSLAAIRSGARTPTQVVVYDHAVDRRALSHGPLAGFEALDLAEPELVEWRGDDGATVYGRLYRPKESATGNDVPPLLVSIHGGPTSQSQVAWNSRLPFFLERGWAVLFPDHRGSTGHGRDYAQAMAGRWGELDVSDCAAGMRAAAAEGWGDPRRMVPMGGSAGGFTVLNLMAHHPELCAAGIDLFGVTDLFDLDETTHRFEKHYLHSIVGPLPDAADRYRDRSPVNVADQITSPLLILRGDADQVVPVAQSRAIAKRLEALGRTVELHEYEGEGHGWLRPETMVDELERIDSFLRRHVLRWRG
jgi:dipeptidyl aminopeptidase/acylaminoacyl peptidase